jgi:hypothetical protein
MLASQAGAVHCWDLRQPPLLHCCLLLRRLDVACVQGQLQIGLTLAVERALMKKQALPA